ncbi:MAG: hypothetical protein Fur0042_07730 [Cyanophyceae cyanobacterium]
MATPIAPVTACWSQFMPPDFISTLRMATLPRPVRAIVTAIKIQSRFCQGAINRFRKRDLNRRLKGEVAAIGQGDRRRGMGVRTDEGAARSRAPEQTSKA